MSNLLLKNLGFEVLWIRTHPLDYESVARTTSLPCLTDYFYVLIRTEQPDPDWFDESQAAVYDKLQADPRFLESFRQSMGYVRLLAELDLLKVS